MHKELQKDFKRLKRSGLTLIEILLVLALMGLIANVAIPKLSQLAKVSTRTGVRRFGALVKYCYDQSVLSGHIHRIVLDLSPEGQSWAMEVAAGDALPEEKIKEEITGKKTKTKSDKKEKDSTGFSRVEGDRRMPNGITMLYVKSWRMGEDKPVTQGKIALYCFPNGFIDDATVGIQEQGRKNAPIWTVKTRSLTGRVDIEVSDFNKPIKQ